MTPSCTVAWAACRPAGEEAGEGRRTFTQLQADQCWPRGCSQSSLRDFSRQLSEPVWNIQQCIGARLETSAHSGLPGASIRDSPGQDDTMFSAVIPNVCTQQECADLIQRSEDRGYVPAVINKPDGRVVFDKSHRDSDRVIIDDAAFAQVLFERLQPHLPAVYHGRALAGINKRLRFLKYSPGQRFRMHSDGCYITADGNQRSFLTLQLYLNTVLEGGETVLYSDEDVENAHLKVPCKPGQVFLFDHDWFHEGAPVVRGVKYCVRTDVMYES